MSYPKAGLWWPRLLLVAAPLTAYSGTVLLEYGLRDDYSLLREAREVPGNIFRFCASVGRPVFGWLQEYSFRWAGDVAGLTSLRLLGVLMLALLGLATYGILKRLRWTTALALAAALLIEFLPSSQVVAAWAQGWSYPIAALFAAGAFAMGEGLWPRVARGWPAWVRHLACLALLALAGLTYQCHLLYYLVFVAAAWPAQTGRPAGEWGRWLMRQGARVAGGLALSYLLSQVVFWGWAIKPSARFMFADNAAEKAHWFTWQVLPDILNFFHLRNTDDPWSTGFVASLAILMEVLVLGAAAAARGVGWRRVMLAGGVWLGLIVAACGVSLIAQESYATYRTLLAASAVGVIGFCLAVRALARRVVEAWSAEKFPGEEHGTGGWDGRKLAAITLGASAAALAWQASNHCMNLFAIPQMKELAAMRGALQDLRFDNNDKVFIIEPSPDTRLSPMVFADEFGSLSLDSDWVPKEMMYQVLHERAEAQTQEAQAKGEAKREGAEARGGNEWTAGLRSQNPEKTVILEERPAQVRMGDGPPAAPEHYDYIIDLRDVERLAETSS